MKAKINSRFMLISAIAVIVTAISSVALFYDILKTQIFDDLKANMHVILMLDLHEVYEKTGKFDDAKDVALSDESGKEGLFYSETLQNLGEDGLRITLVDVDGRVCYDSLADETTMEEHKSRPEIWAAFSNGEGLAMRKSVTSEKYTFYYAVKISDYLVLRLGKDSNSMYTLILKIVCLILAVGMCVFLLCTVLAHSLTQRLVAPIEKMAGNIVLLEEDDVYDEMKPFVTMIKQQHIDILNHARIRQEFTANVSHELKTPLTAISGYAELIASGITTGEDTIHFACEIQRSAERLQYLINDIIKLSELDSDEMKIEFEPLDLHELALNCQTMMQIAAQKSEVMILVEGEKTEIQANRNLMEELIYNLCSNAVRYNKKGGKVTLSTGMEDGHAFLLVKDTGIGIPKEAIGRVFERFYRVDKSRSKSTGGTGLGLAIVKHIVAQHDAKISLESEVGVGTQVKVVF